MSNESTRLLKAESIRGLGSKVAFNFDDIRQRCDDYIAKVRDQAQQLVTDAHAEAETIRAETYAAAFATGRREGFEQAQREHEAHVRELAEKKTAEQLRTVMPALQQAAAALAAERDHWLSHWETAAIRLSVAIAEKILHAELARRPELATRIITEALQLAADSPQIRLRLHPDDLQSAGPACEDLLHSLAPQGTTALIPDPSITRGGCVVETQHGTIDARLETQLARLTAELLEQD
jgi:flagellar biosynthesis/type III secretory pathway protein FliH